MRKKVLDISPPKTKKPSSHLPEEWEATTKRPKFPKITFPKKYLLIAILVGSVLGLGVLAIFYSNLYSKLSLTLTLTQHDVSAAEQIKVDVSKSQMDFEKKVIPGKIFEHQKEKWKTFPSTGKTLSEGKATGTIRVFNSLTPARAVNLVANTRFLSSSGKIFRSLDRIHLPPQGSVEIEVVAAEPGEEYNIGPSKFSVPGLSGTPLYYDISAESTENMKGGFQREVKKVIEEDLQRAKQELSELLRNQSREELLKKVSDGFLLPEEFISEEKPKISCFAEPEQETPDFKCQGSIKVRGFAIDNSGINQFGTESLGAKIPSSQEFRPSTLNFDLSPQTFLWEQGKMILEVSFEGKAYKKIEEDILLPQIREKSKLEISNLIFKNYSQVEDIEFKFWPFWTKTAPSDPERIEITLRFD